eukprot:scaffold421213_cov65-Attheya_sp.AAC.4
MREQSRPPGSACSLHGREITISPSTIMTKPQTTHSSTFRPTEETVPLTHAQTKIISHSIMTKPQTPYNYNPLPNVRTYRGTSTSDSCEDNQYHSSHQQPTAT